MNPDALRFLDRHIGLPLCRLLTALRFLSGGFRRRKLPHPRKVLIVKLSEMGSTVLAGPAFAELEARVAGLELLVLTFARNRPIFRAIVPSATVFAIPDSSPVRMLWNTAGALWRLRREGIDTAIDMDFFSRFSAIAAFLACRGNRVGFHNFTVEGSSRGRLLTHPVLYSTHTHTAAAFLSLVRALEAPDPDGLNGRTFIEARSLASPSYRVPPADRESVRSRLAESGIHVASGETRIVIVNPNSSDLFPLRRWPLSRFAALCSRLLETGPEIRLVITGTAAEQADARALLEHTRSPRCVSLAGRTTFPELLALFADAEAMVTNDSGPAHFAALLQLPTVVLFGPETPALYGPLNPHARCLYSHFACSPCVSVYNAKKSPCTRSLCLEAITVDEVLRHVREILDRRGPGPGAGLRPSCRVSRLYL
jgi:ADP-heptose:LPS heptosyltransferase